MGAPVAAASALAKTKAGRRVLGILLAFFLLLNAVILTPLVAIPFAVVGATASTPFTAGTGGIPAVNGDWGYPLAGSYTKGRGYGHNPVIGCAYCTTNHKGYDMAQGCGSTVYAAAGGNVITAGEYYGYGNTVRIDHGDGLVSLYGHMQWHSLRVTVGQTVTVGTPLGAEGNTGKSFGCHLHYELQQNGTPFDPQPFMAAHGLPLT